MSFSNFLQAISAYVFPIGILFVFMATLLALFFLNRKPVKQPALIGTPSQKRLSRKIFLILPLLCVAILPSLFFSIAYADRDPDRTLTLSDMYAFFGEDDENNGALLRLKTGYALESIEYIYQKDDTANKFGRIHINYKDNNKESHTRRYPIEFHEAKPIDGVSANERQRYEYKNYYFIELPGGDINFYDSKVTYIIPEFSKDWYQSSWAGSVKLWLEEHRLPLIVTLLVAGGFLAVFLGINLAKAEDSAAASKAKQRMWYLVIGVFFLIILLFFLDWLLGNIDTITNSLKEQTTTSNSKFLEKLK